MIISKTPFRISLFGGSTDYESFYSEYGSLLVGFTIDKYCYITVRENPRLFEYISKISYSTIEMVDSNKKIKHDGVRGVLEYFNLLDGRFEITYFSDLPAQTGIGSSSSFVVGLINALKFKEKYSPRMLADLAIKIERNHLKEAGGIQDQIWAAYGGLNSIHIEKSGSFNTRPLPVSEDFVEELSKLSFLIYTGKTRKSFGIASSHDTGSKDQNKINILKLAHEGYKAFCNEDLKEVGLLLKESWESKKKISSLICTQEINDVISTLNKMGMIGGKLIGSGGSGFIFGIAKDLGSIHNIKSKFSNYYVDFSISKKGSEIINE